MLGVQRLQVQSYELMQGSKLSATSTAWHEGPDHWSFFGHSMLGAFGKALVALRFFKRNLEEALEKAPSAALLSWRRLPQLPC